LCRRSSTVQMSDSMVRTLKPYYENCVQQKCNCPDIRAIPSGHPPVF
jgi:hypothetical protein